MKKSQRKLLMALFVSPLHRFKYRTLSVNSNSEPVISDWVTVWTEGEKVYTEDGVIDPKSFKNITVQTLKDMVNAHLDKNNPGHKFHTYHWEVDGTNKKVLNSNHPWVKELENVDA